MLLLVSFTTTRMAVCIAIIAKDNSPQYIAALDFEKELELQYRVHSALDVVDEKCAPGLKPSQDSRDLYLGLLYSTESHKIYGYITNTKIKFIIVIDSNSLLRENEVRSANLNHMSPEPEIK
ncbi:Trafficking protein particle complex subunit 2-like protein [Pseudolycoriella hygida]|uniref:Trafficking protein particle complex subunit 2-like protein n=1 Tax=Pseudolycoriella hygida TaxID=35572 RepID=A0A9Q0N266_9DIPT|nr:Trafficking protein particle complex subunit 2-like protein [Pseudolycoriella hygida]